ncbi:Tim44-like domain-containing protein [Legionella anisa]|uniref:Tim44 domain-containing protein n=1 Tax=Legionella anisa TaxID=28082 RepID=A0AAX0WY44_9GAMM|nr:Tim44-like domain-containing protein [Legionella anisa]AWN72535.1 Tim44 domain-containing protein [Legionella anisa]KTC75792.1 transmembrane protein [Legionella anisa]MCW8423306.1 Tim44-like domain-containing protein [Legionella anisa]MCW8446825.1 Tim44-like domain-containing protein [Legionella anisa]PNL62988.1 Tim44 domain-containing protein [Legionella anisa]
MRTFVSYLLIALLSFGLLINEASAKRFGAGRSFGIQRSQSALFSPNKVQKSSVLGQSTKNPSRWGGLLSGLLIGGLLTSLFMGHGLASGLLSWLVVGAILFFVIGFFRKRMQPGFQTGQGSQTNPFKQNPFNNFTQSFNSNSSSSANNFSQYPEGFVPETFLREAKVTFNRLQAAYDQKNLQDLSEFTAPEVFAEIKMQLDERGNASNKTEVITLDAKLLDVSRQSNSLIASVHFTGFIKEDDEPMSQLDEIWHFRQFSNSSQWVVGGIQQEVFQP